MKWFTARFRAAALRLTLLAGLMLCGGCIIAGKAPLFTATGPGWHVQEGQALWRPGRQYPELGGELVMASHEDGRCLIQFAKTPLPLVQAQTTGTRWRIEFPAQRMRFTGGKPAPTRFAWLYVAGALSGDSLPAAFRFERKPDGGWRLENTGTGETVEGFIGP